MSNNSEIILSVCIPTYNRSSVLKDTLMAIAPQVDANQGQCELIISDNASSDSTKEVVISYKDIYKNIKYFSNDRNLGGRQNIWKATTYASGKYIWILGDDDMPTPGSITHILSILSDPQLSKRLNLLILNSTKVREEFTKTQASWGERYAFATFEQLTLFASGLEIFNHFPIKELGFISALIVKRESWLRSSYSTYPKQWIYAHLKSIVEIAALGTSCYSPRICVLGIASDQSWCLDRGVLSFLYEFPFLYHLAVSKGFSRKNANKLLEKMWFPTVKQYVKALMFSDLYNPSLEKVKSYHSQFLYFWLLILPIHYLLSISFLSLLIRKAAYSIKPNFLTPRDSIDFEV